MVAECEGRFLLPLVDLPNRLILILVGLQWTYSSRPVFSDLKVLDGSPFSYIRYFGSVFRAKFMNLAIWDRYTSNSAQAAALS